MDNFPLYLLPLSRESGGEAIRYIRISATFSVSSLAADETREDTMAFLNAC